METNSRNEILERLESSVFEIPKRGKKIEQKKISKEDLFTRFSESLSLISGESYFVPDLKSAKDKLNEILDMLSVKRIMVSGEIFLERLNLEEWGKGSGIDVKKTDNYSSNKELKEELFNKTGAGITSSEYAVAESGSLAVCFGKRNPRLLSLAPPFHIAIVPFNRLLPFYEDAVSKVYSEKTPSQFAFITGPSMTADIMATSFHGMHGPEKLFVIFVDD